MLLAASVAGQASVGSSASTEEKVSSPEPIPHLVIQGIGKGTTAIDGAWQFHLGDDRGWAKPEFDDRLWDAINVDAPWGVQGHPSYAGFGWYRRHVEILPTAGANNEYRILIPHIEDAYEVYWNGALIGKYGDLPPHPHWYYGQFPRAFDLTGSAYGVLAIRVWKAPLEAFSTDEAGGIYAPPLIGDAESIKLQKDSVEWAYVREDLFDYSLILLRTFVAVLCLMLWSRNRKEQLFVWVAVLTATPVMLDVLQRLFMIPFRYGLARCLNQPIYVLYHVSLWFLLISLLRLNDRRRLMLLTKWLAYLTLSAGIADGILAFFWSTAGFWMQWADGLLIAFILLIEVYPFVLIGMGLSALIGALALGSCSDRAVVAVDRYGSRYERVGSEVYALDFV